jgi:hypothetical protein
MTHTPYEIQLRGRISSEVAAQLGVRCGSEAPAETRLLTGRIDQIRLFELLRRLQDFGVELVELRRSSDVMAPQGGNQDDQD